MKQLSIQQQKEIDQLKTTMPWEKEGNIIDMYSTLYILNNQVVNSILVELNM